MNYRDIIKAKAAALAHEAEFASDDQIKASMDDLCRFGKRTLAKMRSTSFHLGREFDDGVKAA